MSEPGPGPRAAATARPVHHDVLILGGGPSGAAAAIRLARLGFDTALVEKCAFPRSHVGICLGDRTLSLLDFLGLGDRFGPAGFWKRALTAVSWGGSGARFVEQKGCHVDRALLDRLLLEKAVEEGATVYQPARAKGGPAALEDGWRFDFSVAGDERRVTSKFVVDAAGRRPALPGARIRDGLPLVALHADWRLDRAARYDGLIESGRRGWAWYAQTGEDRALVSLFLDPRGAGLGHRGSLQPDFEELLKEFPVLQQGLSGQQCSPPRACDATSLHSADPVGARHIRVGDACMSVDPLSSQGVHLALQSGIQAAVVLNTMLRKPENSDLARHFYARGVGDRVAQFAARARTEYARVAAVARHQFWHERAAGATADAFETAHLRPGSVPDATGIELALAPDAVISMGPAFVGDFVERRAILTHSGVERPVAYLADADLCAMLTLLPVRFAVRDLPLLWESHVDRAGARSIAQWLWQKRILVEAA
jgi:flavin-dependent dehydrogenase